MCIRDSSPETKIQPLAWWFGEDQGRYVVATNDPNAVLERAAASEIPASAIGTTGGAVLTVGGGNSIPLSDLRKAHEDWLPAYMATG